MKVKIYKTGNNGIRPGSTRICIRDAKDGFECWFDVNRGPAEDHITLDAHQWAPAERVLYFRFPEEADNGRYGAWVFYDDIIEKDGWLLNMMVNDAGRTAAAWVRENWRSGTMGSLPKELAELVHISQIAPPPEPTRIG